MPLLIPHSSNEYNILPQFPLKRPKSVSFKIPPDLALARISNSSSLSQHLDSYNKPLRCPLYSTCPISDLCTFTIPTLLQWLALSRFLCFLLKCLTGHFCSGLSSPLFLITPLSWYRLPCKRFIRLFSIPTVLMKTQVLSD